jgi:hypothetical protein
MQNAFSIGTASGIPMDELTRIKLLRTSILVHHVMDKLIEGHDHDYPEFLQQTNVRWPMRLSQHASAQRSVA